MRCPDSQVSACVSDGSRKDEAARGGSEGNAGHASAVSGGSTGLARGSLHEQRERCLVLHAQDYWMQCGRGRCRSARYDLSRKWEGSGKEREKFWATYYGLQFYLFFSAASALKSITPVCSALGVPACWKEVW